MAGEGTDGMSGIVQAYHFVGNTLLDGRPVPPDGVWLEHDGPIAICESGLHASRRPWHALQYAPGEVLCLVELDGIMEEADDKLVARRRRIVRRVDMTGDLRAFARTLARDVLNLWTPPDHVRRYLETGDEELREPARDAASVAIAAARAARAAEWAASAVTWAAASAAVWDVVRAGQGAWFDAMCQARLGVTEAV